MTKKSISKSYQESARSVGLQMVVVATSIPFLGRAEEWQHQLRSITLYIVAGICIWSIGATFSLRARSKVKAETQTGRATVGGMNPVAQQLQQGQTVLQGQVSPLVTYTYCLIDDIYRLRSNLTLAPAFFLCVVSKLDWQLKAVCVVVYLLAGIGLHLGAGRLLKHLGRWAPDHNPQGLATQPGETPSEL